MFFWGKHGSPLGGGGNPPVGRGLSMRGRTRRRTHIYLSKNLRVPAKHLHIYLYHTCPVHIKNVCAICSHRCIDLNKTKLTSRYLILRLASFETSWNLFPCIQPSKARIQRFGTGKLTGLHWISGQEVVPPPALGITWPYGGFHKWGYPKKDGL